MEPAREGGEEGLAKFTKLGEPSQVAGEGGLASMKNKAREVGKQQMVLNAIGATAVERRAESVGQTALMALTLTLTLTLIESVGQTALMAAAEAGHHDAVRLLLNNKRGKKVIINKIINKSEIYP